MEINKRPLPQCNMSIKEERHSRNKGDDTVDAGVPQKLPLADRHHQRHSNHGQSRSRPQSAPKCQLPRGSGHLFPLPIRHQLHGARKMSALRVYVPRSMLTSFLLSQVRHLPHGRWTLAIPLFGQKLPAQPLPSPLRQGETAED